MHCVRRCLQELLHCHGTRFQCIPACVLQHGTDTACWWGVRVAPLLNVHTAMLQIW